MKKGKAEKKMISTPQPYTPFPYKRMSNEEILDETTSELEWRDLSIEGRIQIEDSLYFMETFKFPKLNSLKRSLKVAGEYTDEQIEEIISGLKNLPEYRD